MVFGTYCQLDKFYTMKKINSDLMYQKVPKASTGIDTRLSEVRGNHYNFNVGNTATENADKMLILE